MDGAVPSYVLYSPQGSKPLAGLQVEAGTVSRCYDKSTKSQLLQMNPGARVSFLRVPSSSARPGGSVSAASQRLVALQLCCEQPPRGTFTFTVEFTLQDRRGRRRLLFSTNCARTQQCAQHVKVPLRCATPGQWTNFIFDVPRLHAVLCSDGGAESRRLLQLTLSCSAVCYVRRVMGMPQLPTVAEEWPLAFVLPPSVPVSLWVICTGNEAFLFQRPELATEVVGAAVDSSAKMSADMSLEDAAVLQHESLAAPVKSPRMASQNVLSQGGQVERPISTPVSYELPKPLSPNGMVPNAVLPAGIVPNVVIPNAVILNAVLPNVKTESPSDYTRALEVMRERMRRIQIVVGNDDKADEKSDQFAGTPIHRNCNKVHNLAVRSNSGGAHSSTISPRAAQRGTGDSWGSSVSAGLQDSSDSRMPCASGRAELRSLASHSDTGKGDHSNTGKGDHSDTGKDNDEDEGFTVNICMSACASPPPAVVMPPDVALSKPPVAPSHPIDCLCLDPELLDGASAPPLSSTRASESSYNAGATRAEDDATRCSSSHSAVASRAALRRGRLSNLVGQTMPLPSETSTVRQTEEAASSVSDYRRPISHKEGKTEKFIHVKSSRGDDEDAQSTLYVGGTPTDHFQMPESKENRNNGQFVFDPVLQCCLNLRTNTYVMMLGPPESCER